MPNWLELMFVCPNLTQERLTVKSLCNIKPEIETFVVCSSKDQHELIWLLLHFWYPNGWIFLKSLRVYEYKLVHLMIEIPFSYKFEKMELVRWNAVPELGFPLMQKVNCRHFYLKPLKNRHSWAKFQTVALNCLTLFITKFRFQHLRRF